jgi:hypothetical protein
MPVVGSGASLDAKAVVNGADRIRPIRLDFAGRLWEQCPPAVGTVLCRTAKTTDSRCGWSAVNNPSRTLSNTEDEFAVSACGNVSKQAVLTIWTMSSFPTC